MPTTNPWSQQFRSSLTAACLAALCTLMPVRVSAQTPAAQAWSTIREGATDKSSDQRIATMRVLQLLPGDAKAVGIAENGLKDTDPEVRGAAALSLGAMKSKSAIPQLVTVGKTDTEGAVVLAAAKALIELGDEKGYEVYYALLTGQRKSGEGLVGSQEEEMKRLFHNPKQMEDMAFEQGMGFVPFGGAGLKAYEVVRQGQENELMVKATSIKILAKDPDPRTTKALIGATTEKEWLLRAAAFDALARRGDRSALPNAITGMKDDKQEVQLTAAAAVISLSRVAGKSAH